MSFTGGTRPRGADTLADVGTGPEGLSAVEARERLAPDGPNGAWIEPEPARQVVEAVPVQAPLVERISGAWTR